MERPLEEEVIFVYSSSYDTLTKKWMKMGHLSPHSFEKSQIGDTFIFSFSAIIFKGGNNARINLTLILLNPLIQFN